jgi:hypothetical protein
MKLLKTLFKFAGLGLAGLIGLIILSAITRDKPQTPEQRAAAAAQRYQDQQAELKAKEAKEAEAKADKLAHADLEAFLVAQDFVTRKLKAPSTAKFADRSESQVFNFSEEPGAYRVKSWVDSQNSFGAMLRTQYVCDLKTTDGEHFRLVKLTSR